MLPDFILLSVEVCVNHVHKGVIHQKKVPPNAVCVLLEPVLVPWVLIQQPVVFFVMLENFLQNGVEYVNLVLQEVFLRKMVRLNVAFALLDPEPT